MRLHCHKHGIQGYCSTNAKPSTTKPLISQKKAEMYFDHDRNSEDSDDDLYKGELPKDFKEFVEEKCNKCTANETKLGADGPRITITKREFKELRRTLYRKMVDEGFLKQFVEMLTALCPNNIQDLKALGTLLANPKPGEITDLKERCLVVNKIADRIRDLYSGRDQRIPLKDRLDAITQEILEIKRKRKEELRATSEGPSTAAIQIRDHICNPACDWCQLHCDSFTKPQPVRGKLCDCKCVVLDRNTFHLSKC